MSDRLFPTGQFKRPLVHFPILLGIESLILLESRRLFENVGIKVPVQEEGNTQENTAQNYTKNRFR